jgi:PHD-finger
MLAPSTSGFQFSQDEPMIPENSGEEEDNCSICNQKRQDAWICCDTCNRWFHYSCVGITTAPPDDAQFHCPPCVSKGAVNGNLKRGFSEAPDIFEKE